MNKNAMRCQQGLICSHKSTMDTWHVTQRKYNLYRASNTDQEWCSCRAGRTLLATSSKSEHKVKHWTSRNLVVCRSLLVVHLINPSSSIMESTRFQWKPIERRLKRQVDKFSNNNFHKYYFATFPNPTQLFTDIVLRSLTNIVSRSFTNNVLQPASQKR